jgi:hypothetical protein
MEGRFKIRPARYTKNECYLIMKLIRARVDLTLWNNDIIEIDQSESLLTDVFNEYGENVLRIFNHIEEERILEQLQKLKQ